MLSFDRFNMLAEWRNKYMKECENCSLCAKFRGVHRFDLLITKNVYEEEFITNIKTGDQYLRCSPIKFIEMGTFGISTTFCSWLEQKFEEENRETFEIMQSIETRFIVKENELTTDSWKVCLATWFCSANNPDWDMITNPIQTLTFLLEVDVAPFIRLVGALEPFNEVVSIASNSIEEFEVEEDPEDLTDEEESRRIRSIINDIRPLADRRLAECHYADIYSYPSKRIPYILYNR